MNPIPYIEATNDVFEPYNVDGSLTGDWDEIIDVNSPAEAHFAIDGQQEATLVGYVPWNLQRSCARWFLGFAWVDQSSGLLQRENPVQHPTFPQLYASKLSFRPFLPTPLPSDMGQFINASFATFPPTLFDLNIPSPKAFVPTATNPAYGGGLKYLRQAAYAKVVATVTFSSFRCQFLETTVTRPPSIVVGGMSVPLPQGNGAGEWLRNVYVDVTERLDVLSADGIGQMAFAETSAAVVGPPPIPAGPKIGTPFPAPIGQLLGKADYVLHWLNVPLNYISSSQQILYPENILACVGTVNQSQFLIFDPETVLMKAPSFDIKPFCVPAADGTVMLACDVHIPLEVFSPPNGNPTSTRAGHQLLPYRVNGLWYAAQRINPNPPGGVNGQFLLQETNHYQIFDNPNF